MNEGAKPNHQPCYGIIAGGGTLPILVAESLIKQGHSPVLVGLSGDFQPNLTAIKAKILPMVDIAAIFDHFRAQKVSHIVLAGSVHARPKITDVKLGWMLVKYLPRLTKALMAGDDALLTEIGRTIEQEGFRLVGAHQLLAESLAQTGQIAGPKPYDDWQKDATKGFHAARLLGALDIGQAIIIARGQVVAVEDLAGTDSLLDRIGALRNTGRLKQDDRAMMVKCPKPNQELRIDMPTIGPNTLERAARNGISVIVVEPNTTFVLGGEAFHKSAMQHGISIMGWHAPESEHAR